MLLLILRLHIGARTGNRAQKSRRIRIVLGQVVVHMGDVPSRGVSHLPEQAEIHMLSVPLQAAEFAEYR